MNLHFNAGLKNPGASSHSNTRPTCCVLRFAVKLSCSHMLFTMNGHMVFMHEMRTILQSEDIQSLLKMWSIHLYDYHYHIISSVGEYSIFTLSQSGPDYGGVNVWV